MQKPDITMFREYEIDERFKETLEIPKSADTNRIDNRRIAEIGL